MANAITQQEKDQIREIYQLTGSLKAAARASQCGRNTVRRYLKAEGLYLAGEPNMQLKRESSLTPQMEALDFSFLEKMVESSRRPGDPITYESHIKKMVAAFSKELGITGAIDQVRLENAIFQYIVFRRFYVRSLEASDKQYCGPLAKVHEKLVRSISTWVNLSNQALDQFNRLLRELEIKYHKRGPDLGKGNVFIQNMQTNVGGRQ